MANEVNAPSAVTNRPPEAAPGIPAVEVDPGNELLDGENIDRKIDLLNDPLANVQVDPSGRRLESKEAAAVREAGGDPSLVVPPPAAGNLELRQRTEKYVGAMYDSIGAIPRDFDDQLRALEDERVGLQRRADAGDERAANRVGQVDEAMKARRQQAQQADQAREQRDKAADERRAAAEKEAAGDTEAAKKAQPAGRQAPNKQTG